MAKVAITAELDDEGKIEGLENLLRDNSIDCGIKSFQVYRGGSVINRIGRQKTDGVPNY